jgi:hypothetical protein
MERLRSSRGEPVSVKFDHWSEPGSGADDGELPTGSSLEPHYSVQVLAELWRVDESTIRRMFENTPGVLKLGNERRRNGKREYYVLRIPASIAEREYHRRLIAASKKKGGD